MASTVRKLMEAAHLGFITSFDGDTNPSHEFCPYPYDKELANAWFQGYWLGMTYYDYVGRGYNGDATYMCGESNIDCYNKIFGPKCDPNHIASEDKLLHIPNVTQTPMED